MTAAVSLETICAPSADIVAREIEGDIVIVPLVAGIGDADDELYTLNPTGQAIWKKLDGQRTLKDALNEAMRDWITYVRNTFYIIGSVAGPHPYPLIVRDFQRIIGDEAKAQILAKEGMVTEEKQIEKQKEKHKTKRFNVKETWLPL